MKVAFVFEAIGAALLALVFVPQFGADGIFISVFISISSFCNAGFDILGRVMPGGSVIPYQSNRYVLAVISLLIISGGLGFLVWQDLSAYHRTHHLRTHTKLVLWITGWLLLLGTAASCSWSITIRSRWGDEPVRQDHQRGVPVCLARTAGYNSIPLGDMTNFTKIFMSLLMFIGAAPGGRAGGPHQGHHAQRGAACRGQRRPRPDEP
jgi:trk system potassium uptake protein TrkH